MYCKKREWYRPVAPVMLHEIAEKVTGKRVHHLSKYMLLDFKILPEFQDKLQGVTHINGTARIQTFKHREDNPFIFDLLKYLWKNHKIYALINTSFNKKGEPIVHTKEEALKSAKNMNLDAVIIDYKLIKLE
jgi:carbamoyltransferase